ncbi:hypothetical protein SAMN05421856_102418 [Chryseobacterium taichungense]|uniref:Beta-lactamase n=1 Tax=Chryseobacterium taichungense TaxID=295069 RepID=A0A1H7XHK4_9FLAO|nr:hypothetical protein [Chryseobacterium taichungense]SEM32678.1 hypothetical protein SAMN05421856_102418 [Chryseobacterium taichungense]
MSEQETNYPVYSPTSVIGIFSNALKLNVTVNLIYLKEDMLMEPVNPMAINLFKPLGIDNYVWNFEPTKASAETFCQLYLTPREMVKFGQLYLNKGNWNGKQIISSEWVEQSLKKHSVVQGVNYGYLWWNKYLDSDGAQGNGGQKIYIFQDLDMVVVITGGNYNSQSPSDELIEKYILPSFKK